MGAILTKIPDAMDKRQSFMQFTDFPDLPIWLTATTPDAGASAAVVDGDNGILAVVSGATANFKAFVNTTKKLFTFVDNRSIIVETVLKYAEASTNQAIIGFGLNSTWNATTLADSTGLPAANFSGAMFYKVLGTNVWKVITSKAAVQTITTVKTTGLAAAFVPGTASNVRLRIEFAATGDMGQDTGEVTFWIDGKICYDAADLTKNTPIKHQITYTSAVAMSLGLIVKAGTAVSETVNFDSMGFSQSRTYGA